MKTCTLCREEKSFSEYHTRSDRPGKYYSRCKKCVNEMSREYFKSNPDNQKKSTERTAKMRQERQTKIYEYFAEHPCVDCGNDDIRVLDFDHVRGEKFKNVSVLVSSGCDWNLVLEEIAKCDVRCANCHRIITAERAGWTKHKVWLSLQE